MLTFRERLRRMFHGGRGGGERQEFVADRSERGLKCLCGSSGIEVVWSQGLGRVLEVRREEVLFWQWVFFRYVRLESRVSSEGFFHDT